MKKIKSDPDTFVNKRPTRRCREKWSFGKAFARDIVICGVIVGIVSCFVRPTIVNQTSMLPTCEPGDYLLVEKQAYRTSNPDRFDIIIFKSSLASDNGRGTKVLIKRVIGLPGEHVVIKDGKVYIDEIRLSEERIKKDMYTGGNVDCIVPDNSFFVMGDNREDSIDSRYSEVGCVNKEAITGKAWFRLFPTDSFGKIE